MFIQPMPTGLLDRFNSNENMADKITEAVHNKRGIRWAKSSFFSYK